MMWNAALLVYRYALFTTATTWVSLCYFKYPLPTRCNSTNTVAHESKTPTTVEQSKRESSQLAAESEETTPKKSKKANEVCTLMNITCRGNIDTS